jgi:hypothetical protein
MNEMENRGILLNYAIKEFGSPGILMNPSLARKTSCKCYTYKGEPKLCFSEGIIGAMSKLQIKEFCNPMVDVGEAKQLKYFEKAAKKAHKKIKKVPKGKKFEKWISEMGKALKEENVEI